MLITIINFCKKLKYIKLHDTQSRKQIGRANFDNIWWVHEEKKYD